MKCINSVDSERPRFNTNRKQTLLEELPDAGARNGNDDGNEFDS